MTEFRCPQRPAEGIRSPGAGAAGAREPVGMFHKPDHLPTGVLGTELRSSAIAP